MKRIFKYNLKTLDEQRLKLPKGSKILSVTEQYNEIILYAMVDDDVTETETYSIIIHGTGHIVTKAQNYEFIDTVKLMDGQLMFHLFYKYIESK